MIKNKKIYIYLSAWKIIHVDVKLIIIIDSVSSADDISNSPKNNSSVSVMRYLHNHDNHDSLGFENVYLIDPISSLKLWM